MYGDINGMFCCCGCQLLQGTYPHRRDALRYAQENSIWLAGRSAAILHLRHHKLYGHKFPRRAERQLIKELKEEGEFMVHKFNPSEGTLFTATFAKKPSPWKGPQTKKQKNEYRRVKRMFKSLFTK